MQNTTTINNLENTCRLVQGLAARLQDPLHNSLPNLGERIAETMLQIIKPTEAAYTHRLEFNVLMQDLTNRKVEINFNGWDNWFDMGCSPGDIALTFHALISKGLTGNSMVLGWKARVINLEGKGEIREYNPVIKPNKHEGFKTV